MSKPPDIATLAKMDQEVSLTIQAHRSVHIQEVTVKRELAVLWLAREVPAGFWARLTWFWRIWLLVMDAR